MQSKTLEPNLSIAYPREIKTDLKSSYFRAFNIKKLHLKILILFENTLL